MANILSDWNGYRRMDFQVDGRASWIVCPHKACPGNPWVWRAEFFGAFDTADRALLEQGWHIAYHRASDMYGCPQAVRWMRAFDEVAIREFQLSPKPVLFGFSRGGLYSFQYACAYPDDVLALYLDAPVLDIRSWPGAKGASIPKNEALWHECLQWYGLTEATAATFRENPLDKAAALARTGKVPILLVAGLADRSVPYAENGAILKETYKAAGGDLVAIEKPDCDHHPHSLEDPAPIVDWIWEQWRERGGSVC